MEQNKAASDRVLGRFLVFCLLLCLIALAPQKQAQLLLAVTCSDQAKYYFYTSTKVKYDLDAEVLDNGAGSIVICSLNQSNSIKGKLANISGESVSFYAESDDLEQSLNALNANVVFYEEVGNRRICYAYTDRISDYVRVNNERVNLQLVYSSNNLIIGTPLILGSH